MDEDQRKHLELIQAIVARLAANSFTIKGWSVTIGSALLAFSVKDSDWHLALLTLLPILLFWGQDAYLPVAGAMFPRILRASADQGIGTRGAGRC